MSGERCVGCAGVTKLTCVTDRSLQVYSKRRLDLHLSNLRIVLRQHRHPHLHLQHPSHSPTLPHRNGRLDQTCCLLHLHSLSFDREVYRLNLELPRRRQWIHHGD